jgi:hypothetical protein
MTSVEQRIKDIIEDLKSKSRERMEKKLVQFEKQMFARIQKREVDSNETTISPFFKFHFRVKSTYKNPHEPAPAPLVDPTPSRST